MHRNRLAAGLCALPLPDLMAGFRESASRETGKEGRERKGRSEDGHPVFETWLEILVPLRNASIK